jgi:hypothetical protein
MVHGPSSLRGIIPSRLAVVKTGKGTLIRGFQFKSSTHWVKIYERIHGLGRDRRRNAAQPAAPVPRAVEYSTDSGCELQRPAGLAHIVICVQIQASEFVGLRGPRAQNHDRPSQLGSGVLQYRQAVAVG